MTPGEGDVADSVSLSCLFGLSCILQRAVRTALVMFGSDHYRHGYVLYAFPCTVMVKPRPRIFIALAAVVGAAVIAVFPIGHEFRKKHESFVSTAPAKVPLADDISRLNATPIYETWDVPRDGNSARSALREILKQAESAGMHVSLAGARHSMGGQTIAPGGIRVNMLPLKSRCWTNAEICSTSMRAHFGLMSSRT
jgi:hypothetical protein